MSVVLDATFYWVLSVQEVLTLPIGIKDCILSPPHHF